MQKTLAVIAPRHLWDKISSALQPTFEVEFTPRQPRCARTIDPYQIAEIIKTQPLDTEGILLIAPVEASPSELLPAPVIEGKPVGIVQAETVSEISPWLNAMSQDRLAKDNRWVVLAMWKELYLSWGNRFLDWMRQGTNGGAVEVSPWFSDLVSRDELCGMLATGPAFAVYVGHGRSRGWSGYRGLRWEHVESLEVQKPCGVIVSLSCDTLKREKDVPSFGSRWIRLGRSCAFVGSTERLGYLPNADFALELGQVLSTGKNRTIGELMVEVYRRLKCPPERELGLEAFSTYRIMGNPLQPLY